ncbi:hypothetical protein V1264_016323 [Littorina saxatilis]|uniref:Secreted protein n=1 Tax=Littorina saxatilis TaxID=31220 RepID=A0AAN9BP51_9CAEN
MAKDHAPLCFLFGAAMVVLHDIATAVERESRFLHVSAWWRHRASCFNFQRRMKRLCVLYSLCSKIHIGKLVKYMFSIISNTTKGLKQEIPPIGTTPPSKGNNLLSWWQ